jgi:NADH-quinone oxidoreductase subunit A
MAVLAGRARVKVEDHYSPFATFSYRLNFLPRASIFLGSYRVERFDLALGLLQQGASYGIVYLYVGIFMLLVTGFVATTLLLARLISPGRRSSAKSQNYETGEMTVTDPWRPFPVRYYVFALLFLVFDVEAAFLFPWAVIYRSLGVYGFVEMVIFVSILAVGLIYAWKKGALKWV